MEVTFDMINIEDNDARLLINKKQLYSLEKMMRPIRILLTVSMMM